MPQKSKRKAKTLDDYLDDKLRVKLEHIREHARNLWAQGTWLHPLFTLHGPQHAEQIELILGHIMAVDHPDHHDIEDLLDPEQIFCLLASAWLHDVGMIVPPTPAEEQAASSQGLAIADWIREEHHKRSREYVEAYASDLWLDVDEAGFIGKVCLAHRKESLSDDSMFSSDYPNIKFLGALLRAADELDISKARTPPELMNIRWSRMDTTSQWHWLKHWCVLRAVPYHEELKDEPATPLFLTYQYIIRLPSYQYRTPFIDRIMKPIREVVELQGVDSILREQRLGIACDHFKFTVQVWNDPLPDGTRFEDCLKTLLMLRASFLASVVSSLAGIRSRNATIAAMLERQCQKLINIASDIPEVRDEVDSALIQYLNALTSARDLQTIEDARDRFNDMCRETLRRWPTRGGIAADIEREWFQLAFMGWRLASFMIGNEEEKHLHLGHVVWWLGAEANELAGWVATQTDLSPSLRQVALSALAKHGTAEYSEVILNATLDQDAKVRDEGVKALKRLPGSGTYERLGEIIDTDIDGEVRQAAKAVLRELIEQTIPDRQLFSGRKVLLIEDDRYVISPLVDALMKRKIVVRVETDITKLQSVLQDWKPEVVVCELFDLKLASPSDGLPGFQLVRLACEILGPEAYIIATSVIDPEEIVAQLASIRAFYIRKPTTVETYVRTIETLLSLVLSQTEIGEIPS